MAFLLAPKAFAGGWGWDDYLAQKAKSDWDGYGVGTLLHNRLSQEVNVPGQGLQKKATEERTTLTEITDTEYVLKVEKKLGVADWVTSEVREPKDKGITPKVEELGEATFTIDGTEYPCVRRKVAWMKGEVVDKTEIVWVNAEHGIVKMEKMGDRAGTIGVTKLDVTITVGDVTLPGREMALEMKTPQGMTLKGTAQMSLGIPENIVHHSVSGAQGPVTVKIALETLAFVKK